MGMKLGLSQFGDNNSSECSTTGCRGQTFNQRRST